MNVLIINKSDITGGAAVVSYRLLEALNDAGVEARMLVVEKGSENPLVKRAASGFRMMIPFLEERLEIFLANGMNRDTLFKIDTCSDGLPLHKHPWVKEADVICLAWINQGMLSLKGIKKIAQLGKPVFWTMHDMWNLTGICHHAGQCVHWKHQCGNCWLLGDRASDTDLSNTIHKRKRSLYDAIKTMSRDGRGIHFIAVSNWVADLARKSTLMHDAKISVIPNPIEFKLVEPGINRECSTVQTESGSLNQKTVIMFGAARLDDPVKGLPVLRRTMEILGEDYPEMAVNMELQTFGGIKDSTQLEIKGVKHRHLGILDSNKVSDVLSKGDIVLSTSLYETLPTTLIEGQVYGCIPVSLNRGGQADIIDHKRTGYLAQWAEDDDIEETSQRVAEGVVWAVKKLQSDPRGIRSAMYESAKSKFSASSVAARYIEIFSR